MTTKKSEAQEREGAGGAAARKVSPPSSSEGEPNKPRPCAHWYWSAGAASAATEKEKGQVVLGCSQRSRHGDPARKALHSATAREICPAVKDSMQESSVRAGRAGQTQQRHVNLESENAMLSSQIFNHGSSPV